MSAAGAGGAFPVSRPQMVAGFPPPPAAVEQALTRVARKIEAPKTGDADADAVELARLEAKHAALPRPWIPASCPPFLRKRLWLWLDQVATWLNRDYLWRPDKMIPPCWVAHPHIVHELAVLACLRHSAERESDPKALEEWHRYTLPTFTDRMITRLSTAQNTQLCLTDHDKWPGLPAYIRFTDDDNQHNRQVHFDSDSPAGQENQPRRTTHDTNSDMSGSNTGGDSVLVDHVTGVVTEVTGSGSNEAVAGELHSEHPDDPGPTDPNL